MPRLNFHQLWGAVRKGGGLGTTLGAGFKKAIFACSRIAGLVAATLLVILALLTVSDICGRFLFNRPIIGTTELTEYMLAIISFFAIAWAAMKRRHIKVDLIMSHFPPKVRMIIDNFTGLLSLGIYIIIAWRLTMEGLDIQRFNIVSTFLAIPKYPFYYLAALGCVMLVIVTITELLKPIMKDEGTEK